jgi:amidase/aspartyl-tRNA(Asn)/glutamyl-tRNA(Gln) amidotransferase subunit A
VSVSGVENQPDAGTVGPASVAGEAIDPLLGWCLTYPFNLTGHPAASVPVGLTPDGLPVGLQVVGRMFRDDRVLAVAAALEEIRPWASSYERVRALW